MGDRHNIGIIQNTYEGERDTILWLYSHSGFYIEGQLWEGFAGCVAMALDEARPRWDDESYFTRIIIHTLGESVRGIHTGKATGDEHKRYVIDAAKKEVYLLDNWSWDGRLASMPEPLVTHTFGDFVNKYRKHDKTVRDEY